MTCSSELHPLKAWHGIMTLVDEIFIFFNVLLFMKKSAKKNSELLQKISIDSQPSKRDFPALIWDKIDTFFSEIQPLKHSSPTDLTEGGIDMLNRDEHPKNAFSLIVMTFEGMSIICNDEQLLKHSTGITVTESGSFISVRDVQLEKANWYIELTEGGMFTFVSDVQSVKSEELIAFRRGGRVTSFRLVHWRNAALLIWHIEEGNEISANDMHA